MKKQSVRMAAIVICVLAAGVCYSCGGLMGRGDADGERTLVIASDGPDGGLSAETAALAAGEAQDPEGTAAAGGSGDPVGVGYPGGSNAPGGTGDFGGSEDLSGAGSMSGSGGEQEEIPSCYVHICGEVVRPGVYELPAGSRIFEAVEMAGGFTEAAAASYLNLAQEIADGMKIVVPSEAELEADGGIFAGGAAGGGGQAGGPAGSSAGDPEGGLAGVYTGGYGVFPGGDSAPSAAEDGRVNINTAGKEELMTLKGIGEARAEDIIRYREENGPFGTIEDIMKVSGIKEAAFNKIKDDITV